jgi:hypothetical protein
MKGRLKSALAGPGESAAKVDHERRGAADRGEYRQTARAAQTLTMFLGL